MRNLRKAAERRAQPQANHPGTSLTLLNPAAKVEELNAVLQIALNSMPRGLSMFDADRRLVICNDRYREIYGIPDHLARPGTPLAALVEHYLKAQSDAPEAASIDHEAWIEHHVSELLRRGTFTHTQRLRNGRVIQVTNQALPEGGWVDLQEDITQEAIETERVTWLARHCTLTETANRTYFDELINSHIKGLGEGGIMAVHLIDLDCIKAVNETHGHAAGAGLLKAVARRIRAALRDGDIIGRITGDQFAVGQSGMTEPEQAERLAQRLVRVLNAPYRVLGADIQLGASIGIAIAPSHGETSETLLSRAEMAAYQAKSLGRGCFSVYERSEEPLIASHMAIEQELDNAELLDQLALHYQPIISLSERKVAGVEALMRWRHPKLDWISPATFIPIAERTGHIHMLGAWALMRACSDAMTWKEPCKVTVNVSAVQLERSDIVEQVSGALRFSGLPPERLELEITESVILSGGDRTRGVLDQIRKLGVRVALDDFGTAFASLSYLRDFSFDKLKIDSSFVKGDCQAKSRGIVTAVAGLARALEIGSVAEGVETPAQLDTVRNAGCDEAQGYYFSAAVPSCDVDAVIKLCVEKLAQLA